jgi:hypothetical protein
VPVLIALKPRNEAVLQRLVKAMYTKNSPTYHHYLAKGQYATLFGASQSTIDEVKSELTSLGLKDTASEGNGLFVTAKGSAAAVANAFHVTFKSYHLRNGSLGYAATGAPKISAQLASVASGVVGLSTLNRRQPLNVRDKAVTHKGGSVTKGAKPAASPHPTPVRAVKACTTVSQQKTIFTAHPWTTIAASYKFTFLYGQGFEGATTSVGLFELANYPKTNITKFTSCFGLSSVNVTNVPVNGGATKTTAGQGETTLDIQDVLGLAPKTHLYVYSAKNITVTSTLEYSRMVSDDLVQVISSSWGLCEQLATRTTLTAENEIFAEGALQGQTVFSAAGDTGTADCALRGTPTYGTPTIRAVDDPSSQPFVTGVGGTSLATPTPSTRTEAVWNRSTTLVTPTNPTTGYIGGAGGGGVSTVWAKPSWQTTGRTAATVPKATNATHTTKCTTSAGTSTYVTLCRQTPDVSATADPYFGDPVYCLHTGTCTTTLVKKTLSGWEPFGGTSAAAPLWAAATAIVNEACGSAVGFLNPLLYTKGEATTGLNDITAGTNNGRGPTHAGNFSATVGFDNASGWGSPYLPTFKSEACPGSVSDFSVSLSTPGAGVGPVSYAFTFTTKDLLPTDGTASIFIQTPTILIGPTKYVSVTETGAAAPVGAFTITYGKTTGVSKLGFILHSTVRAGSKLTMKLTGVTNASSVGPHFATVSTSADPGTVRATYTLITPVGYEMVGSDGGVFSFQPNGIQSHFEGSLPGLGISVHNIVGMVSAANHNGYYLVGSDGGVFSFGTTSFEGSLPGLGDVPALPIVGIVPTPDDKGYFLVGADGGVFAFGDAQFEGSLPGQGTHVSNVVALATTAAGTGYWVVTATGTVYSFGTANNYGSIASSSPVTAIVASSDSHGYYLVESDGGVATLGDAQSFGTLVNMGIAPAQPVKGLVLSAGARGYWLIGADGGIFSFGDAPYFGSLPGLGIHITNVIGAVENQ